MTGTHTIADIAHRAGLSENEVREAFRLYGATEAAAILGIPTSNLYVRAGMPEPHQRLAAGTIWLAEDFDRYAESVKQRGESRSSRTCRVHGDQDMRPLASGGSYCAVCNRERGRLRSRKRRKTQT